MVLETPGWGEARSPWPAPLTYRCNIRAGESSRELGAGSSEPVVWPEWGGPLQTGMKYLEAHIPGKWELPSKMKC